ncbi:phosphotransferase family protein [Cytobacillus sp. FJAT-54145]|uniref:Phosphotransferase family protein n=1 Tax=Cytobacillus spartinae TaxID=3299023 RepID=A0ABW6KF74_9BACI
MIEQALQLLKNQYGEFTPIRLTGGYTNETFLLKGTAPSLVAKVSSLYNQDVQNEIHCLNLTKETGITPKVHKFIQTKSSQVTIMEYLDGINGQSIIDRNDIEGTKKLYKSLGRTLAKSIHSQPYQPNTNRIKECNLNKLSLDLDFVPEHLRKDSKKLLQGINDLQENWVLTHGDYGVHNVLYSEHLLTVLDWEWSEWANPLTDIGWVCWFTKLHYPKLASSLNSLFLNEYLTHRPVHLSPDVLKAYCVYKVWKVLHRVMKAPVEVQKEWVRRLEWTLETELLDI